MSTAKQTARNLIEEAKKRIVLLLVCVFGLSYLMSLTSSSVWVNFPAATTLIIFLRYISLDLDVGRRTVAHSEVSSLSQSSKKRDIEHPNFPLEKSSWRRKVNSPAVEAAIDQFMRHLVSEWMTDLWYSRITPDKDGPEELVCIMNDVFGEVSCRARDINLISLLTRDIVNLFCDHLELYRTTHAKIGKQLEQLSDDCRDTQLRLVLAAEKKLHPALFSVKAEHKVLQLLMSGLISCTFKPQDLGCSFFRYTVRELLACAVMRPILNLANPRVINEKIESLVLSFTNKADKGVTHSAEEASGVMPGPNGPSRSGFLDRSTVGVELVQFKHNSSRTTSDEQMKINGRTRDPKNSEANLSTGIYDASLVPMKDKLHTNAQISQSSSSVPFCSENSKGKNGVNEWGQMLDIFTRRKTQALAPENIENMWTKGRNYRKIDVPNKVAYPVLQNTHVGDSNTLRHLQVPSNHFQNMADKIDITKRTNTFAQHEDHYLANTSFEHGNGNQTTHPRISLYQGNQSDHLNHENLELESESSYPTEEEESSTVTGLDSPGTRVWDSKNKRDDSVSHIRHPLENFEVNLTKRTGKGHSYHPRITRTKPGRKRSRSSKPKVPIWHEIERTSFDRDVLNESIGNTEVEKLNDDPEVESWGRVHSGAAASSSTCPIKVSDSCITSVKSPESFVLEDSFLKLSCEVLGGNVVKSGSGTFAVYSIAVTCADNNSWSIKRRFRHFEELHRRLKEFPDYNLSLPPKHFLSSGLDAPVIEERCKLLDKYLKKLLQLPTVSGSIEVWDFLSVDSQTYIFSDSLSIIQTLSVDLDEKPCEAAKIQSVGEAVNDRLYSRGERLGSESKESFMQTKNILKSDNLSLKKTNTEQRSAKNSGIDGNIFQSNSGIDSENRLQQNVSSFRTSENAHIKVADGIKVTPQSLLETVEDPTIPIEWIPPNLSMPILDLVDVIFQLQDGGWIRRQAFWIAKQVLQLGMGDAFDDWLIEKIQLLRKGSVLASGIKRIEQILWPDGIFITKHPNMKPPTPLSSPKEEGQKNRRMENVLTPEQQLEAARRAKFVYELMIDKPPAALVGLVGRKEYERCAQDIYFFLQSSVCMKQLAFELVELLLLAAFPELDDVVRQFHEEKEQFGAVED